MGDEADAMWDAEMIEEGREFAAPLRQRALSRGQFIVHMMTAYGQLYPLVEIDPAVSLKHVTNVLDDFIRNDRIKFGDPAYDWTEDGAFTLVREYEAYA